MTSQGYSELRHWPSGGQILLAICTVVFICLHASLAQAAVNVAPAEHFLDGTFTIQRGNCLEQSVSLNERDWLMGSYTVNGAFDKQIAVELMDSENYALLKARRPYIVFSSDSGVVRGVQTLKFQAPKADIYYARFCNSQALVLNRTLSARIYSVSHTPSSEATANAQPLLAWLQSEHDGIHRIFTVQDFDMTVVPCGVENAFSYPNIVLCQELVDTLQRGHGHALDFVLAHELGHSLLNLWGLPLSDNEDMADEFATMLMIISNHSDAASDAVLWWANSPNQKAEALSKLTLNDRHTLSVQRARNIQNWLQRPRDLAERWINLLAPHFTDEFLQTIPNHISASKMSKTLLDEFSRRGISPTATATRAAVALPTADETKGACAVDGPITLNGVVTTQIKFLEPDKRKSTSYLLTLEHPICVRVMQGEGGTSDEMTSRVELISLDDPNIANSIRSKIHMKVRVSGILSTDNVTQYYVERYAIDVQHIATF